MVNHHLFHFRVLMSLDYLVYALRGKEDRCERIFNDSKEAFVDSSNYSGLLLAVLIGNQVNELLNFDLFDLLTQKLRQQFNVADCF